MSEYAIRRAAPPDLDRLVALQLALQDHLEASCGDLWRMSAEARAGLRAQLAGRLAAAGPAPPSGTRPAPLSGTGQWVLVAEHPVDGVVAVLYGRVLVNNHYTPARTGTVDQVYVQPEHRRRGLASRLVAEIARYFAAAGVEDVSLRYVAGNAEAAAFWTALGFTPRIVTAGAGLAALLSLPL